MPYGNCGRCYCQEVDVILLICEWQRFLPILLWQMLYHLQYVATPYVGWCYCQVTDGIATYYLFFLVVQMLLPYGRWNSHTFLMMCCDGRCYCPVADGMATAGCGCSLLVDVIPRGRWMFMGRITLVLVLRCSAEPHPIYEVDGICLCFC